MGDSLSHLDDLLLIVNSHCFIAMFASLCDRSE